MSTKPTTVMVLIEADGAILPPAPRIWRWSPRAGKARVLPGTFPMREASVRHFASDSPKFWVTTQVTGYHQNPSNSAMSRVETQVVTSAGNYPKR